MGLIKAAIGAAGGVLADQWKEFFYCDSMPANVLVTRGVKSTSSRSSNTKGMDNVITDGSGIAVADGQAILIVEDGKVVEFSAEPGNFTYKTDMAPSILSGSLNKASLLASIKKVGERITYGGDAGHDQRIYYFNTKEIIDNKFGTANPIPFKVVDADIGFKLSLSVRCSGVYSYKIVDPILFYTNVCGNIAQEYTRSEIDTQLKTEFISALQPAMAKMSALNLLPEELIAHNTEMEDAMREVLTQKWSEHRGIEVMTVAFGSVTLPEESQKKLQDAQTAGMYRDASMAAGAMTAATTDAMRTAAGNSAGAMTGFMGMNMAMGNGNLQGMYQAAAAQQPAPKAPAANAWTCKCGAQATGNFCPNCGGKKPAPEGSWTCKCGTTATGKFCPECGSPKPEENGWTCSCGQFNQGKFCSSCGGKKPAGVPTYKCDKCGWVPADPTNPPKFCPECGDLFDDSDINA